MYFVSAMEDHIAPWKATYAGTQLTAGKVRFVAVGFGSHRGHDQSTRCEQVRLLDQRQAARPTADEWLAGAKQHEGSWWNDWAKWLAAHRGKEVPARIPGKGKLKVIEPAPGTYARIRADGR